MRKEISIIGCGMGTPESLTQQAAAVLKKAQLVFGPERLVKTLAGEKQRTISGYHVTELMHLLETCREEQIAVLVSGDSGFYSAAALYAEQLAETKEIYTLRICPGISSLSYLSAKTAQPWGDAVIYSIHGRAQNYYASLCAEEKFVLLGGNGFSEVLQELARLGYGKSEVWIGEKLGSAEERIQHGTVTELLKTQTDPLSLMLVRPDGDGVRPRQFGIADDAFVRGDVPITKSEVRAVVMSRLAVGRRDVVYDIGAGTGSVSVECSIAAAYGTVFAIEQNAEALQLLEKNKERFLCRNLQIVSGMAPEALRELPAPEKAFVGGSKGKMQEILKTLLQKNPKIHAVINVTALETLQETLQALKKLEYGEPEIAQIAVSRAVTRGRYHMMEGLNPVYIITVDGSGTVGS